MSGGRNFMLYGGLAVAGAGGYYLYSAGGDPKVAQKKVERESSDQLAQLYYH